MILTVIVLFRGSSIFILPHLRGGGVRFQPREENSRKTEKNRGKKKVKKREKMRRKAKNVRKGKKNSVKRRRNKDVSPKFMSLGKKIQKIFHSLYF